MHVKGTLTVAKTETEAAPNGAQWHKRFWNNGFIKISK